MALLDARASSAMGRLDGDRLRGFGGAQRIALAAFASCGEATACPGRSWSCTEPLPSSAYPIHDQLLRHSLTCTSPPRPCSATPCSVFVPRPTICDPRHRVLFLRCTYRSRHCYRRSRRRRDHRRPPWLPRAQTSRQHQRRAVRSRPRKACAARTPRMSCRRVPSR